MSTHYDWNIRDCLLTDTEALLCLWKASETNPTLTDTPEGVERVISSDAAVVLVAEENGHIIGSAIGTFDGWRGNIYRLAVRLDARRRGVARSLVTEVEKRLAGLGAERTTALVEKTHPWATGFWDAAGYEMDGRMARYVK